MELLDYRIDRLELDRQIGTVVEDGARSYVIREAVAAWGLEAPLSLWQRDTEAERVLRVVNGAPPAEIAARWREIKRGAVL